MVGNEVTINSENAIFLIKTSSKYEKNLQTALDYSFQNWGAITMVNLHLQVINEIEKLAFSPYSNPKNRFLNNVNYREIILQKYPYVITYCIDNNIVRVINIIHTSRNPISRKAKR